MPDLGQGERTIQQTARGHDPAKTRAEKPGPAPDARRTVILSPSKNEGAAEAGKSVKPGGRLVGWLVTFSWDRTGQDHRVTEGRTRIGTGSDADIRVEDALMSSDHAQMIYRNGVLEIKDSFSTNGTVLNGTDIRGERTELKDGDILKMGNTVFKLRMIGDIPNV